MYPEIIEFPAGLPVKALVRSIKQYPYHWHSALEIIQVLKGSLNISLGDEDLRLQENGVAIVNMDELHRITPSPDNEVLFLQIDSGFYRQLLPDDRYLFLYCCSVYHEDADPGRYRGLKEHIARLVRALLESPGLPSMKTDNLLTGLLDYITCNFDFLRWGCGTTPFGEKQVERIRQIARQISRDYKANPGLVKLAAGVEVSPQHLSHSIREKFGAAFLELLQYSRCEQAAKLLLSTDERVLDIALECGFSDPKYLIRHFKTHYHCTPSEFRRTYRVNDASLAARRQYEEIPLSSALT